MLFSADVRVNAVNIEKLLHQQVVRVFKSIDTEDSGFISCEHLEHALLALELGIAKDAFSLSRLRGFLKIEGDIILWSDFWSAISKLKTGHTLDAVIDCGIGAGDVSSAVIM